MISETKGKAMRTDPSFRIVGSSACRCAFCHAQGGKMVKDIWTGLAICVGCVREMVHLSQHPVLAPLALPAPPVFHALPAPKEVQ